MRVVGKWFGGGWRLLARGRRLAAMGIGRVVPGVQMLRQVDVTSLDRQLAEHQTARAESERFARATVDALREHIAILDETGRIIAVNRAWRQFELDSGKSTEATCEGADYLAVSDAAAAEGQNDAAEVARGIREVIAGRRQVATSEYACHSPHEQRWFRVTITRFDGDGPVRVVVAHEDITARKLAEDGLRRAALTDELTGLPNRRRLVQLIGRAIERAQSGDGHRFAVLFLDFDRFKIINDSLGHECGDDLLVQIAERLSRALTPCQAKSCPAWEDCPPQAIDATWPRAVAGRLGGDEFVVLLEQLVDAGQAEDFARRLQNCFTMPFRLRNGHDVHPSVSIGIRLSDDRTRRAADVLRDADTAMYQSKSTGPGRCVIFNDAMHEEVAGRLELELALRRALHRGELQLHYQPIVDLLNARLNGFEALLRWNHPQRGVISPAQFIPVAEESGLIVPIGLWVIEEALRQLKRWDKLPQAHANLSISVNLAPRQLIEAGLVGHVARILNAADIAPDRLRLEITESAIMHDAKTNGGIVQQLKNLGPRIELDDFGTGHSSLSSLHQFPLDGLKIDRSFIRNMTERIEYTAVVQAIVTLAQNLGIRVTAEGIETLEQLVQLQTLDCDLAQGYYFARPMPAADAQALLIRGIPTTPTAAS